MVLLQHIVSLYFEMATYVVTRGSPSDEDNTHMKNNGAVFVYIRSEVMLFLLLMSNDPVDAGKHMYSTCRVSANKRTKEQKGTERIVVHAPLVLLLVVNKRARYSTEEWNLKPVECIRLTKSGLYGRQMENNVPSR